TDPTRGLHREVNPYGLARTAVHSLVTHVRWVPISPAPTSAPSEKSSGLQLASLRHEEVQRDLLTHDVFQGPMNVPSSPPPGTVAWDCSNCVKECHIRNVVGQQAVQEILSQVNQSSWADGRGLPGRESRGCQARKSPPWRLGRCSRPPARVSLRTWGR